MEKDRLEAKTEMERLSELLRKYQHAYYIDNRPIVSDLEYDRLFDLLTDWESRFPDLRSGDSPTHRVGSDLASDLPEVIHSIPVLSLDKAYSAGEVLAWMDKIRHQTQKDLSFVIEEKIDGISMVLYYEEGLLARAVTRGNGVAGNDVTGNIRTIGSIPLRLSRRVTLAVRGEIYLPRSRFEEINKNMETPYANPRNLAAGTIRRIRSREVARVPLDGYFYEGFFNPSPGTHREVLEELASLGFRLNPRIAHFSSRKDKVRQDEPSLFSSPFSVEGSFEDVPAFIEKAVGERQSLDYEIDGLVIKINEMDTREELGYTGHHPRWALAYKFESPQGETTVKDIRIQVGRTGRITPVARVEPVSIGGSTISNVTLHNQEYIQILELAAGDRVTVSKRGDVIPAVEKVVEKNEENNPVWRMPPNCPSCGTALELKGAHHFCLNPFCPDQVRGRLFFFAGKGQMDIENLGPETMETLINLNLVKDIQDIYTMDLSRLEGVPGFGEKKINLIREGIEKSRTRPFKVVLASLGLPELGLRGAEMLINAGFRSLDKLLETARAGDLDAFREVEGIGDVTAGLLVRELTRPEILERIEGLRRAGLNFRAEEEEPSTEPQIFSDQTWCVTGSFINFKPRELAMEEIKKRGGRTVSAVTGKTTHLLAGEGAGSKLAKARTQGAGVVTEEEFLKILETGEMT